MRALSRSNQLQPSHSPTFAVGGCDGAAATIKQTLSFSFLFFEKAFLKSIYRHHKSFPFTSLFQFFPSILRSPSPSVDIVIMASRKVAFQMRLLRTQNAEGGVCFLRKLFPCCFKHAEKRGKESEGKKRS